VAVLAGQTKVCHESPTKDGNLHPLVNHILSVALTRLLFGLSRTEMEQKLGYTGHRAIGHEAFELLICLHQKISS